MSGREPAEPKAVGRIAFLAMSMLLASLGTSIANIALPDMASDFSTSFHSVRWVVMAYLGALTPCVLIAGWLGDRCGLGRMIVFGLVLFTLSSALCAASPGIWFLVVARALQGAAAAFLMTLSLALVRDMVRPGEAGRTMGMLGTMSAFGTALAPSLGGWLIAVSGWRSLFWLLVGAGFLALAVAVFTVRAVRSVPTPGRFGLSGLRDTKLVMALAANMAVAAVMMTTLVVGPFYLIAGLGLSSAGAGLVMSVGPVISILTGVPSGRLVDRHGCAGVMTAGVFAMALGCLGLALLPGWLGVAGYLAAIAALTPGYQMFQAANNTSVTGEAPPDRRGVVSGFLGLSRNVGLIIGASAMSAIFALGAGVPEITDAPPESLNAGLRLTFLTGFAMMALVLGATRRAA